MNKIVKLFITFISAITLTLVTVSTSSAKVEGEYIVLGAAVSLTGKYSSNGVHTQNGYNLAVDRINSMGGVKVGGKSYKFETIKLYNKEIIAFASFAILTFFFASRYALSILSNINLDGLMIYYQRIHNEAKLIDFLNWFTLLICMYLWLNRKKLTNTDVFIATQYLILSVLLIYLPMPNIFGRYTYYVLMGGSIIIGKLITTLNSRLGISLLIFLFCYDIYSINYSTELVKTFSERLYSGYLNPAYGLTAMILNYDTILNFKF